MNISKSDAEMQAAHSELGGFIARCSLLDFRVGQFVARWFCDHDKQKFLSYTLKAMPFAQKRQVIEERLTNWHDEAETLRETMSEIAAILERRDLAASGVLSRNSSGGLCIKSFSAARYISEDGEIDILKISDLSALSERASELAERLVALAIGLRERAS